MVTVFTKFSLKEEFKEEYTAHLKEAVKKHNIQDQAARLITVEDSR